MQCLKKSAPFGVVLAASIPARFAFHLERDNGKQNHHQKMLFPADWVTHLGFDVALKTRFALVEAKGLANARRETVSRERVVITHSL